MSVSLLSQGINS